jgi:hypothetical protein
MEGAICTRSAADETPEAIAQGYSLSHQRIHQIVQRWC